MKNSIKKIISSLLTVIISVSFLAVPLSVSAEINNSFVNSHLQTSYGDVDNNFYFNLLCEKVPKVQTWFESKIVRVCYELNGDYYCKVFQVEDVEKPIIQYGDYFDILLSYYEYYTISLPLEYAINSTTDYVGTSNGYTQSKHLYFNTSFSDYWFSSSSVDNSSHLRMTVDFNFQNEFNKVEEASSVLPLSPSGNGHYYIEEFIQWLKDNNKTSELSSLGLSSYASMIDTIVRKWDTGNPFVFVDLLKLGSDTSKNLYNWVQQKYNEFLVYYNSYGPLPYDDSLINRDIVNSSDSDTTTDSILKQILIAVNNLPYNIFAKFTNILNTISSNVYNIASNIYNLPVNTANAIYNNFVEPINEIIESVKNIKIDGSTSNTTNNNTNINIDIDNIDQTENNFNIAFGDLQLTLENKFEFYHQITNITQTIQNYTYSSETPQFKISVGSEFGITDSDLVIDFSFFEPYRDMFRKIIVTVAYISFILSLLHKLPQIIGGI